MKLTLRIPILLVILQACSAHPARKGIVTEKATAASRTRSRDRIFGRGKTPPPPKYVPDTTAATVDVDELEDFRTVVRISITGNEFTEYLRQANFETENGKMKTLVSKMLRLQEDLLQTQTLMYANASHAMDRQKYLKQCESALYYSQLGYINPESGDNKKMQFDTERFLTHESWKNTPETDGDYRNCLIEKVSKNVYDRRAPCNIIKPVFDCQEEIEGKYPTKLRVAFRKTHDKMFLDDESEEDESKS